MKPILTTLLCLTAAAACSGAQKRAERDEDFRCRDRRAMYVATGTLLYAEQGIRLSCEGDVPLVEKFFIAKDGTEKRKSAEITSYRWEEAWEEFESAGWRLLGDCPENPSASERDPIYTFEVSDGEKTGTFMCRGIELPFPYDRLRNALDLAAAGIGVESRY